MILSVLSCTRGVFELLSVVTNWRFAMVDICHGLLQVVIIFLSELHDSVFAIKSLPNDLVRLDKLVDLSRQFVILVADDANVIVH